ncbi:hypothetical protein [Bernardetia sp.]|nr:hypothetical protein [Bernardetia sp.]
MNVTKLDIEAIITEQMIQIPAPSRLLKNEEKNGFENYGKTKPIL